MDNENKIEEGIKNYSQRELGNVKVLMVEDDQFLSEMVLSKLSMSGCIPYSTDNGSEAIALVDTYRPDVIILDLMLPGLSGEEILKELKSNEELKSIPVIVFSNKSEQSDIEENLAAGAARYLVKSSTDLNVLVDVIKEVVRQ